MIRGGACGAVYCQGFDGCRCVRVRLGRDVLAYRKRRVQRCLLVSDLGGFRLW
jgi:hypothetical protein